MLVSIREDQDESEVNESRQPTTSTPNNRLGLEKDMIGGKRGYRA